MANKETKLSKNKDEETAIFKFFSHGINTAKDEWLVNISEQNLYQRITFFIDIYNNSQDFENRIKWSRNLKIRHNKNCKEIFNYNNIKPFCYRPFSPNFIYFSEILIDERGYRKQLGKENLTIAISGQSSNKFFHCLVSDKLIDLHCTGDSQCLPLYRYEKGERIDNITDWGLEQFREYYHNVKRASSPSEDNRQDACFTDKESQYKIKKENIFYYVYGVLHNPKYRQKYELNLKREFPRIPFYDDFWQWVKWGKQLMDLHLNYETIKPYELKRIDVDKSPPELGAGGQIHAPKSPTLGTSKPSLTPPELGVGGRFPELGARERLSVKPKLRADKINHQIIIDEVTTLTEIPPLAWEYKLGNRSALEWILDQYKEKKPKDKTIAEKFNNYRFADYKEEVIDLLMKVTTVSMETMKIINEMNNFGAKKI
ncbi:type ISP restriction/modification enzyme [Geminocystis sp.]|uniref:type ISP restriction/modification enzyme n=1 Tax=Geminocystis sp. TaxID=2664100 RepID=UPI0035933C1A